MRMMSLILGIGILMTSIAIANAANFALKSRGFKDSEKIPAIYTCDRGNLTPALNWSNPPAKTMSYTLFFSSLDTPFGLLYNWVLYNIPSNINELPEGMTQLPEGILTGNNSFGEKSYRGPCPPDALTHHYVITIYALDTILDLSEGADPDNVIYEMKGHILNKAELKGKYNH